MKKLYLATRNPGKAREFRRLLEPLGPVEFATLLDRPDIPEIEETGETFEENARIKAVDGAARTGLISLADDSGLAIDALGGWPGVVSARIAPTASERNALVLERIRELPENARGARYVAVAALAWPDGRCVLGQGECAGAIALAPRGSRGFGYDPIFWLPDRGLAMAEVSDAEKDSRSHRAAAVRALLPALAKALADGVGPD